MVRCAVTSATCAARGRAGRSRRLSNTGERASLRASEPADTVFGSPAHRLPVERGGNREGAPVRPPNIVVVMADDLGFGDIGCCNYGATCTPAIDALAAESVVFSQHYSASPVWPRRVRADDGALPPSHWRDRHAGGAWPRPTRPRRADHRRPPGGLGYATGLVGKWHLGALEPRYHPNARGFDEFVGFRGGWSDYYAWRLDRNGSVHEIRRALPDRRPHRRECRPSSVGTAPSPSSSTSRTTRLTSPSRCPTRMLVPSARRATSRSACRSSSWSTDGSRHRARPRRAPALASGEHRRAVHQRQRSVDARGVGLRDDGPLQHGARRGQGAGARGGHSCADDRPLADRGSASTAPSTRSHTSPTGCRRCSPSPATARRDASPATASTCWRRCAASRWSAPRRGSGSGRATGRRPSPTPPCAMATGSCATRRRPSSSPSCRATRPKNAGSPPTPSTIARARPQWPDRRFERQTPQLFDLGTDPGENTTSPTTIRNAWPAWSSSLPIGTRASSRSERRCPTIAPDRPASRSHDPTSVQCDMVPSPATP